ncbi:MAG: sulfite exporter TauE/SafE family protein [Limnobacter sp.]|uniref:sulfite exporter TauE/SafE family protein n=1 Tax=Limnobacter sp. TaxID=2003368 RepID=UPI0032ED374B
MLIYLIVVGAAAGFFAGMFGIGGGAIVIPVLIHIYNDSGIDPTEAIRLAFGTSLAAMAFTGFSSFVCHRRQGNVDSVWIRKLVFPAGLGALVGAVFARHVPGVWLAICLSVMLGYFGVKLLMSRNPVCKESPLFVRFHQVAGLLSGVAYSLAGMGGASVVTFYLSSVGLPLKKAIGTSTGVILPISVGAIVGFGITAGWPHDWRWGYIDLYALPILGAFAIVFSRFGVKAASVLPTQYLRRFFGAFMLALAAKTLLTIGI